MVPYDRIAPADFYRQIDWIRDEWDDRDEYMMAQKIMRLERLYERLPTRYYEPAVELLDALGWCRIVADQDHHAILRQLVKLVREWNDGRRARAA